MSNPWLDREVPRGDHYDQRFARLAATGMNMHGEADFVESLFVESLGDRSPSAQSVLDAGCGTGRVAIELARRGLDVVGVDLDPSMLDAARAKAPELAWHQADLAKLNLDRAFDAVLMAGNVMVFVTPGSEEAVVQALARHLTPGGRLIAGFSLSPALLGGNQLPLARYDDVCRAAGCELVERWSTWDRAVFAEGGDYAVSVHRRVTTLRPHQGG